MSRRRAAWGRALALARVGLAGLLLAGLGLAGPGCERLREKQALRRYAAAEKPVIAARGKVEALDAELRRRVAAADVPSLRTFFKERYLPRYREWLAALQRMPVGTKRLTRIHQRYRKALASAREAHETFADQLTAERLPEAWKALQGVRARLREASTRYRQELDAYYRKHDLRRSRH